MTYKIVSWLSTFAILALLMGLIASYSFSLGLKEGMQIKTQIVSQKYIMKLRNPKR